MAVNKAQATGTRRIMEWFDRNATTPYFSVWSNTTPSKKELNFGWYEEDLEAGRNKLENDLKEKTDTLLMDQIFKNNTINYSNTTENSVPKFHQNSSMRINKWINDWSEDQIFENKANQLIEKNRLRTKADEYFENENN
jgi:hypothetical protein